MIKINFKQDVLPHLIAIAVFYVVTIVFFSPLVFEKKSLSQHDIKQGAGGAQELIEYAEQYGEQTLWTNSMFGGMPSYLMGMQQEGEVIVHLHRFLGLYLPHPASLVFIAAVCCYIMLVTMRVRSWLAIAGGLAFAFTGFSIIALMAGHNAKVAAVAYMPLVFAGVRLAFRKQMLWGFVLTALGMALELRSNHLQITYYLFLIILFFGISELVFAIRQKELPQFAKTVGILVVAVVIGIGCNLGRIWTVMEYSKYSTRGKSELTQESGKTSGLDRDYAFQYSNGIMEPLFLFIPNFFGGSSQQPLSVDSNLGKALMQNGVPKNQVKQYTSAVPTYWGSQPLTAPYYAGAILVFFLVLGLMNLSPRDKYWALAVLILGLMLSWGKNFSAFNYLMFDVLPGYNKFRSVTFTIIMTVWAMVVLGLMGAEKMLSEKFDKANQKKLFIAFSITGGFALLCVLFAGIGSYKGAIDEQLAGQPAWFLNAIRADRADLLRSDALRSLIFVLGAAATIWLYLKGKLSQLPAAALVVALVLVDMFGVAKRFLNDDNYLRNKKSQFVMTKADGRILADKSEHRVLNLINPFNDGETSYHHHSIGGYHGAKMGRYQDLITEVLTEEHSRVISSLQAGRMTFEQIPALNMLNAKYFKFGAEASQVIPNPDANGNAWFVQEVVGVNGPDEEIATVKSLDSKRTAVIDQTKFDLPRASADSLARIALTEYLPNHLTYSVQSQQGGLAVFSEIYYPAGWEATIDGKPAEIIRANYVLRALQVPAGAKSIEFTFRPKSYYVGDKVSLASGSLLILMLLGCIGWSLKGRK